jgi:hypothetical protein
MIRAEKPCFTKQNVATEGGQPERARKRENGNDAAKPYSDVTDTEYRPGKNQINKQY